MTKKLIFICGLPGSGKSTMAEKIYKKDPNNTIILTTDDFYMIDGKYNFDVKWMSEAHKWNQGRAFYNMFLNVQNIIIPNTNLQSWQIYPYAEAAAKHGYTLVFKEPNTDWKNNPEECVKHCIHGLTLDRIKQMMEGRESVASIKKTVSEKFNVSVE